MLTALILFPLFAAAFLWLVPAERVRVAALLGTLGGLVLGLVIYVGFLRAPGAGWRHELSLPLGAGVAWDVGVDGLSAGLIALSGLISVLAVLSSWHVERRVHAYFSLLLVLCAAMTGVFVARDWIFFFIAWEAMLVPMFLLIAIWGGEQRRYAAVKFLVYTMSGSVLLLAVPLLLWWATPATGMLVPVEPARIEQVARDAGLTIHEAELTLPSGGSERLACVLVPRSFRIDHHRLLWHHWTTKQVLGLPLATVAFWCLFLAFAVKVPLLPFHTWLPHAHVQAPTAISVILAGVLLKLGVYGFLRLAWPLFPVVAHSAGTILAGLGVAGIVYAAWVALMQTDLKRLVAYASVSHMGFCLLGLASLTHAGVSGSVVQMLTHGLGSSMLFLLVGVIYDRCHHRRIDGFGGLAAPMPLYAGLLTLGCLAGAGLPMLSGFPGELLSLMGAWQAGEHFRWLALVAATSVVLSAAYLLWMLKRVAFGPVTVPAYQHLPDCDSRERLMLLPLAGLIILIGVWPRLITDVSDPAVAELVRHAHAAVGSH